MLDNCNREEPVSLLATRTLVVVVLANVSGNNHLLSFMLRIELDQSLDGMFFAGCVTHKAACSKIGQGLESDNQLADTDLS